MAGSIRKLRRKQQRACRGLRTSTCTGESSTSVEKRTEDRARVEAWIHTNHVEPRIGRKTARGWKLAHVARRLRLSHWLAFLDMNSIRCRPNCRSGSEQSVRLWHSTDGGAMTAALHNPIHFCPQRCIHWGTSIMVVFNWLGRLASDLFKMAKRGGLE